MDERPGTEGSRRLVATPQYGAGAGIVRPVFEHTNTSILGW